MKPGSVDKKPVVSFDKEGKVEDHHTAFGDFTELADDSFANGSSALFVDKHYTYKTENANGKVSRVTVGDRSAIPSNAEGYLKEFFTPAQQAFLKKYQLNRFQSRDDQGNLHTHFELQDRPDNDITKGEIKALSDAVKMIQAKSATDRTPAEQQLLNDYEGNFLVSGHDSQALHYGADVLMGGFETVSDLQAYLEKKMPIPPAYMNPVRAEVPASHFSPATNFEGKTVQVWMPRADAIKQGRTIVE